MTGTQTAAGGVEPVGDIGGHQHQQSAQCDIDDNYGGEIQGVAVFTEGQHNSGKAGDPNQCQHHAAPLVVDQPGADQERGDDGDIAADGDGQADLRGFPVGKVRHEDVGAIHQQERLEEESKEYSQCDGNTVEGIAQMLLLVGHVHFILSCLILFSGESAAGKAPFPRRRSWLRGNHTGQGDRYGSCPCPHGAGYHSPPLRRSWRRSGNPLAGFPCCQR